MSGTTNLLLEVSGDKPLQGADVGATRERTRLRRLRRLAVPLAVVLAWLWWRLLRGDPAGLPSLPAIDPMYLMTGIFFLVLILATVFSLVATGRSPHVVIRPEQIDVGLDDVVGIDVVKAEVIRTLNLFLAHRTFSAEMGGRPRRGVLFEGPPGTGKTHTAKALAKEAGVPFLMASATSFQSSMQGASQRQIRSFFKALRKAARQYGGAIGFIDEFDAIAMTRPSAAATLAPPLPSHLLGCGGLTGLPMSGQAPVTAVAGGSIQSAFVGSGDAQMTVNELLVQMQSFDQPTGGQKLRGKLTDLVNLVLRANRQLKGPGVPWANIMLLASTNTADRLDPALMRPGRFDQRLSFDLPSKAGRRQIVDHFLSRKAHEPALDADERRDALAAITQGYSPAMLEGLLDEALVRAIEGGRRTMSWADLEHARMITEIGLGQPVGYTSHEERLIATHEAGHATVAWLVAPERRLEVLTIIKRRDSLGLLSHGDAEDVFTRSRSELRALIKVAFGGQVAEELFFGDVSTGPAGDLQYATSVAVQMVGAAGMLDTLVSYAAIQGSSLSSSNLVGRVLGDSVGRELVENLLQEQKRAVRDLLSNNRHLVAALRDALLERHELIGPQITEVLQAAADRHGDLGRPGVALMDGAADDGLGPAEEVDVIDLTDKAAATERERRGY
ncbi:AAA family ATPase [Angustibacter sp. McL0619]|uniref:AAA family ATPase n=1 Tax=Angustibacter sp. McL0619 TaxID=3415676 RepID=UPI003CF4B6CA